MSFSSLQVLAEHRDALLLAEVGAWLHMLGKFHEDFLKGNYELDTDIPADLTKGYPELDSLLRKPWPGTIWTQLPVQEFQANGLGIYDLIKQHRNPKADKGFLRLMQDAHGRGSGIEKGVLDRFASPQSGTVYLATAVGTEAEAIDLNELSSWRKDLYVFLQTQLGLLYNQQARVNWSEFRKPFIQRLERDFRTTVADTRRPLNDVSLFDQTSASVAFFKATLAQNLLLGWKEPNPGNPQDRYRWRILRVGLDGLAFWSQAVRSNDLLSRKRLIAPALEKTRRLLEETYPLGMEIYHDDNGSLFIVPDVERLLEYTADGEPLSEHLQAIALQAFDGEARFELTLSEPTRNTLSFGQLATDPLPQPVPFLFKVETWWKGTKPRDLCPICGLRPQGPSPKAVERKVCDTCEERRAGRAKEWTGDQQKTIWVDEVADSKGRGALLVGRLGLKAWLCGEAFNTIPAFEPSDRELQDEKRNDKKYRFRYQDFLQQIEHALSPRQARQKLGRWVALLDNLLLNQQRGGFEYFLDVYSLYVQDTDLGPNREAWRFALALMRQQPAFARLRRVWETTQRFWTETVEKEILANHKYAEGMENIELRCARLLVIPDKKHGWKENVPYDGTLNGQAISLLWRDEAKCFVTISNLQLAAGGATDVNELAGKWERQQIVVTDPDNPHQQVRFVVQSAMRAMGEMGTYAPYLPLLSSPDQFLALVPANDALAIAEKIRKQYTEQFGKVQNRLPLFLGVVFFQRKLPLMAVMDTARRMLKQVEFEGKTWKITHVSNGKAAFENGITWDVPTTMGDGSPDHWYPYFFVEGDPGARRYRFQHNGRWLVHAGDLRVGDTVRVQPSRFAFKYLEHTAQRFEFGTDKDVMLLDELPWLVKMWNDLKQNGITDTRLRGVQALLETKAAAWGEASQELERLAETTLKDARLFRRKDKDGNPLPDIVTPEDVKSGHFHRCLELHTKILKLRVKEEKNE